MLGIGYWPHLLQARPVPSLVLVTVLVLLGVAEPTPPCGAADTTRPPCSGCGGRLLDGGHLYEGQAALPLVTVLLVAFTMIWYMIGVEHADPMSGDGLDAVHLRVGGGVRLVRSLLLNPRFSPTATASPSSWGR